MGMSIASCLMGIRNFLMETLRPRKKAVECDKFVATAVEFMNSRFIKLSSRLEDAIGDLQINPNYIPDGGGMPINMLRIDLTRELEENNVI
jgi:hypothetical protein